MTIFTNVKEAMDKKSGMIITKIINRKIDNFSFYPGLFHVLNTVIGSYCV